MRHWFFFLLSIWHRLEISLHVLFESRSTKKSNNNNNICDTDQCVRKMNSGLFYLYVFININIRMEFDEWSSSVLKNSKCVGKLTHSYKSCAVVKNSTVHFFHFFFGFILICLFISLIYVWFGWNDKMSYGVDNRSNSTHYAPLWWTMFMTNKTRINACVCVNKMLRKFLYGIVRETNIKCNLFSAQWIMMNRIEFTQKFDLTQNRNET